MGIFRWLGCQFIKGYKEATSPNRGQADLPMKELAAIDKAAINRPVSDLQRETPSIIDVITHRGGNDGHPHLPGSPETHADRVKDAIGNMFMDITCSNCGSSKVIRAGACGCCTECGTSQGCS